MSGPSDGLHVEVSRKVHPGLVLDVSLTLGAECGVVFGASGAGKTSLLRLIAGLDRPDSGVVRVAGSTWFDSKTSEEVPLRSRRVGMIFQDDLLFPHLSVWANVGFGLKGWRRPEAKKRVEEVAALCGVAHLMARRPATLSGGERQRVGLARALAPRPRLLLCDEPVSALDLDARFSLIERLKAVQTAENVPLLQVTHSPSEAVALASRLFLLDSGRIIDEGPPLDVLLRRQGRVKERIDDVRNVHEGRIAFHDTGSETAIALAGGPTLIVPRQERPKGSAATVAVRAEDILLARPPISELSARNRIDGEVERVIVHGGDAEVIVRAGATRWIVAVVASAVGSLGLSPGSPIVMIIKARSCHVL